MASISQSALKARLSYRKFERPAARVLLLDGNYHLVDACEQALVQLGHTVTRLALPTRVDEVVRGLLWNLVQHEPDMVLTINHMGFDDSGHVAELLESLQIPVAVWYVDSPLFVLRSERFPAPAYTTAFTWESGYTPLLLAAGATHVHNLPLAVSPAFLTPTLPAHNVGPLLFVGDSMATAISKWKGRVTTRGRPVAEAIRQALLNDRHADIWSLAKSLWPNSPPTARLDAIAYATWRATADYRTGLLTALAAHGLQIVGDAGWRRLLPQARLTPPINHGPEVASLYAGAAININATSLQMPKAVNQRLFDVPAAGGFLLTDAQNDVARLFHPETEVATYRDAAELREKVSYYLAHPEVRATIVRSAQERIRTAHRYEHRLAELVAIMRRRHGLTAESVKEGR